MTVEATLPAQEPAGIVASETGRQASRLDDLEAIGLLLGILLILLVWSLVIGVTPPGA